MNKSIQLFFGIIAIALLASIAVNQSGFLKRNLGNLNVDENAYSSGVTYTSSTISNNVATVILARATSSRTFAKICDRTGATTTWIYKQATTTGAVLGMGSPIFATTTHNMYPSCLAIDSLDPYLGQLVAISGATTTLSIESLQQ